MLCWILLLLVCLARTSANDNEPMCLSRYDYDYKVLQQLVTLEQHHNNLKELMDKQDKDIQQKLLKLTQQQHELKELTDTHGQYIQNQEQVNKKQEQVNKQQEQVNQQQERVNKQQEQVDKQQEQTFQQMSITNKEKIITLEQDIREQVTKSSSTYVRWGQTKCPANGTELVYAGYVGGSDYRETGGAVNYLCLPSDPLWGEFDDALQNQAIVGGAEYEIFGSFSQKLFKKNLGEYDVPCVVCRSNRASVVMIPARNACYGGLTLEYSGYLTGGHRGHNSASEFVCLDGDPEVIPGSESNENGKLFYVAEAYCRSLKCPPYVNGRELACAVCTK